MPRLPQSPELSEKFLIVGEGDGDASFVKYLCEERSIAGFHVEEAQGNRFESYLTGLRGRSGFDKLVGILIVSDNDDSPEKSFGRIRKQIKCAGLPHPSKPAEVARCTSHDVSLVVLMIPFAAQGTSEKGCLETLILPALEEKHAALAHHVTKMIEEAGVVVPTKSGEDKRRVRMILAMAHHEDPNIALSFIFSRRKGLLCLAHTCFDRIAEFLQSFESMLAR